MEVTGKNQDECMIALHDCNEDVNRAINFLLESTSDTVGHYPRLAQIARCFFLPSITYLLWSYFADAFILSDLHG